MGQNHRRYEPAIHGSGMRTQAAFGTPEMRSIGVAKGTLQALVLKVYYVDDRQQAFPPESAPIGHKNPTGIQPSTPGYDAHFMVIDVVTYGADSTEGYNFIARVPVCFGYGSLQDGDLFVPRDLVRRLSGAPIESLIKNYQPHEFDCDHCLVEFVGGDPQRPFVRSFFRPLRADVGTQDRPGARVTNVKRAEGRPRLAKWAGTAIGVDTNGNAVVDLQRSHTQEWDDQGREPRLETDPADSGSNLAPTNGTSGNFRILQREGSTTELVISPDPNTPGGETRLTIGLNSFSLRIADGPTLDITLAGADSQVVIGGPDSAHSLVRFQELNAKYTELKARLDTFDASLAAYVAMVNSHVHASVGTPPSPPLVTASAPAIVAPAFDPAIESPTFKVP